MFFFDVLASVVAAAFSGVEVLLVDVFVVVSFSSHLCSCVCHDVDEDAGVLIVGWRRDYGLMHMRIRYG